MKLIFLVVFLCSSLFDPCFASEIRQDKGVDATQISIELRDSQDNECCGADSESKSNESKDVDSLCTHCLNCHLWNLNLPIPIIISPRTQSHVFSYEFRFTSPSLDGPKRPPKIVS